MLHHTQMQKYSINWEQNEMKCENEIFIKFNREKFLQKHVVKELEQQQQQKLLRLSLLGLSLNQWKIDWDHIKANWYETANKEK